MLQQPSTEVLKPNKPHLTSPRLRLKRPNNHGTVTMMTRTISRRSVTITMMVRKMTDLPMWFVLATRPHLSRLSRQKPNHQRRRLKLQLSVHQARLLATLLPPPFRLQHRLPTPSQPHPMYLDDRSSRSVRLRMHPRTIHHHRLH